METNRKLASIQLIAERKPIIGADLIEAVRVNGWWLVSKAGEFEIGDKCVYFEIDSFLPVDGRFEFLRKSCFKQTSNLGDGFRLRTIRLRGQVSQGLALPISSVFPESSGFDDRILDLDVGSDVTELVGVVKWEMPVPAALAGKAKGNFPSFIPKTDQERCQNLVREIRSSYDMGEKFEVTVKLDGSSTTAFYYQGQFGVCSRNFELKTDPDCQDNAFVEAVNRTGLVAALANLSLNIAVQAELMGPGVQGNREGLKERDLFVYDIYNIDEARYLNPAERMETMVLLHNAGFTGKHVPILEHSATLIRGDVDGILALSEGPSLNHHLREGLVFKSSNRDFSFKAIANSYLLGEK